MNKDFRKWYMSVMEVTEEELTKWHAEDGSTEEDIFTEMANECLDGFRDVLSVVEWAWDEGRTVGKEETE